MMLNIENRGNLIQGIGSSGHERAERQIPLVIVLSLFPIATWYLLKWGDIWHLPTIDQVMTKVRIVSSIRKIVYTSIKWGRWIFFSHSI